MKLRALQGRALRALSSAPTAATMHFTQTLIIAPDGSGPGGELLKPHEKVAMRVAVSELGLSSAQLNRLALVAGPRLDASKGVLTLVARVHETAEENQAVVRSQLRLLVQDALDNGIETGVAEGVAVK